MVREIICLKCSGNPEFKKYYESNAITGEWRKEIKGRALRTMSCNKCNDVINENSDCFAVTTGTDNAPYYEWEYDFINNLDKENGMDKKDIEELIMHLKSSKICLEVLQNKLSYMKMTDYSETIAESIRSIVGIEYIVNKLLDCVDGFTRIKGK